MSCLDSCLDVPVPGCLREHVRSPPFRPLIRGDCITLDLVTEFGERFKRPAKEIKKACMLASGYWDLIVILERPRKDQDYDKSFNEFVEECPTLKAVDELIKFASNGSRSIHNVTVLDAFSFSPAKPSEPGALPTMCCHELVGKVIKAKTPKVVICCWRDYAGPSSIVSRELMSRGVGTWPPCERIDVRGTRVLAIRSFHPVRAVCYRRLSPCTRMTLIYHFVLAFNYLNAPKIYSADTLPWAEDMSQRCRNENKDPNFLNKWMTTPNVECIPTTLIHDISSQHVPDPLLRRINTWPSKDKVNFFLGRLCFSDYSGGALPLVELCLVFKLWDYPEKEGMIERLKAIGSRQQSFQTKPGIDLRIINIAASKVTKLLKFQPMPQEILDDLEEGMERLNMSNNVTPNQP
ncbi:hypothetical protein PG996_010528 [Apiospora saccharicola]|uniref:Uncharacterized protein n=1 Tax=Apiospora saccharicola TaxID=335842 RepID=A0ABR1UNU5_9PEZI